MSIEENVTRIRAEIAAAAREAGREPGQIQLCAATKMNDAEAVRRAITAGVDCCGENRVQELTAKRAQHAYDGAPVDFIGHLQRNKVRQVVGRVRLIQSVDSLRQWTVYPWECPLTMRTPSAAAVPWSASAPPFSVPANTCDETSCAMRTYRRRKRK